MKENIAEQSKQINTFPYTHAQTCAERDRNWILYLWSETHADKKFTHRGDSRIRCAMRTQLRFIKCYI